MKKLLSIVLISFLMLSIGGCRKKQIIQENKAPVTLSYYKLYENQENLNPLFTEFRKQFPYVTVNYRKFTDPDKYYETILNEFAEGRGPDVFSVPNWWVKPNYLKLSPAPSSIVTPEIYKNLFLDIAAKDNLILDTNDKQHVYGIPLSIDTLAVYYNKAHFEAAIPERGKPAATWNQMQSDARVMNFKQGNALIRSLTTLGAPNSNSKEIDIFYTRLLQNGIDFYNKDYSTASFAKNSKTENLVKFQLSFSDHTSPNYSTNQNIVDPESANKEVEAFLTGKTSMIFGYSHLYKDLLKLHQAYKRAGKTVIDASEIRINPIPQESMQADSNKVAYANYFSEVVSKNSQNKFEAWALISQMVSKPNLEKLYKNNFKPTSRRDMIATQRSNRVYSAFVNQLGIAKSLVIADDNKYREYFSQMFEELILDPEYKFRARQKLSSTQALINQVLSTKKLNQIIAGEKE